MRNIYRLLKVVTHHYSTRCRARNLIMEHVFPQDYKLFYFPPKTILFCYFKPVWKFTWIANQSCSLLWSFIRFFVRREFFTVDNSKQNLALDSFLISIICDEIYYFRLIQKNFCQNCSVEQRVVSRKKSYILTQTN
jgi:hypothetical protein